MYNGAPVADILKMQIWLDALENATTEKENVNRSQNRPMNMLRILC